MRYFMDAPYGNSSLRPPKRPRLLLLSAVAEFVNAAILYEHVMTGPGVGGVSTRAILQDAARIVGCVNQRLSWAEIFAVLALAKATAVESACDQRSIDLVGTLLIEPLENDLVLRHLDQVNSNWDMSPHKLPANVNIDDYYLREFSSRTLWEL